MSAALAGALATAKAANPGARTAAAHAREGQATTARSKKWVGAASRRSAQAALEASRGQWRPLVPPYPHRGSNRWLSQHGGSVFATALFVAAGFTGRPTGGIYRPGWCCIAAPMPRPPHLASLACSWRMASLVLASCGLGERCQRAGCVAVAVLLAEWRARGSCITTRLHLNLPQS